MLDSQIYNIPLSLDDDYILDTFERTRYLRYFNNHLRGRTIPVGDFHYKLHDQVLFDCDRGRDKQMVSLIANKFELREPRYKATVLSVNKDDRTSSGYSLQVHWLDKEPVPDYLRVSAVMCGERLIRIMQFGVER